MAKTIKVRRGLAANIPASSANTAGELRYTTDTNCLYVDNGAQNKQLTYPLGTDANTVCVGNDERLLNRVFTESRTQILLLGNYAQSQLDSADCGKYLAQDLEIKLGSTTSDDLAIKGYLGTGKIIFNFNGLTCNSLTITNCKEVQIIGTGTVTNSIIINNSNVTFYSETDEEVTAHGIEINSGSRVFIKGSMITATSPLFVNYNGTLIHKGSIAGTLINNGGIVYIQNGAAIANFYTVGEESFTFDSRTNNPYDTFQRKILYENYELNTGKQWNDGSQIYSRVISANITASANTMTLVSVGISNVNEIISVQGMIQLGVSQKYQIGSYCGAGYSAIALAYNQVVLESLSVAARDGTTNSGVKLYIEYTKV